MDMQATKKKLGLKEKYAHMTRGLGWETTYQPMEKVFPQATYEGIKVHDWDKWEDPFRLTMDAYWKYQAEKERKLYAVLDAFAQNNGHLGLTDARYLSAVKLFLTGISPLEYMAHRGFAAAGRNFPGVGPRVACLMQSIDEIRHAQTQIHAMSNYNKFYEGFHAGATYQIERVWYLSVPKSFFDDAFSAGPFEWMVAIGFSFEYVLTNLLFVPFMSGAAYNGDMATVTFGFSAQSDEARHMTLGLECIKFMLEQDPDNLPIVQKWIDKWAWRGIRVLSLVATMMDYMLPKRVMSWKEAWEIYFEQNGGALFNDLAKYGIKVPDCIAQCTVDKEHLSHQLWLTLCTHGHAMGLHTWLPNAEELDWLSAKYPNSFDQYYRPRFEKLQEMADKGERFYTNTLPMLCQVCQIPMLFTEPDDPGKICYRESDYKGEKYHTCSDGCKHIFDDEPEKYIQSWLPVHQIYMGNAWPEGTDPTAEGFNPLAKYLEWCHIENGKDNGDYEGSSDQANFAAWRGMATQNI
jgi:phenol/toluene 2-monooxygenase (NADH) P3/A3